MINYKLKYNKRFEKLEWELFINPDNEHLATPEAVDLIRKMVVFDHVIF